jgi:hypothetical protein
MRHIAAMITALVLTVGAAPPAQARKGTRYAFNSGQGPAVSGLRLAVGVDRAGKHVFFRIRNGGAASVVINKRFSCSGYSHWWLQAGNKKSRLSTAYRWSPQKQGFDLSSRVKAYGCTVNYPTRSVTLKPGQTTVVKVPLAKGVNVKAKRYLRGEAAFFLTVHKHIRLKSRIARRLHP